MPSYPKKSKPARLTPAKAPVSALGGRQFPTWLAATLLAVMTTLAYLPLWHAGFIWDDDVYVTGNPMLHSLAGLGEIWMNPHATVQYYPLVHTSFWLEYHLWALTPLGYHVVNVLLHALAAILLWRALERLQLPGAWLAAGIFAFHPMAVESVAWVTERKNVLSAVFYFSAALAYWRWDNPLVADGTANRRRWRWYFIALVLFLLALFSKTVTSSLPAALLLVFWWKRGRLYLRDLWPLVPFFLAGAGLGLTTAWLERVQVGAQGPEWDFSFPQRCLIAGRVVWFYAGKLCWPSDLMFIYPRWQINAGEWWQWMYPATALALVAGLWQWRGRIGRGPLVAALFFGGTLFPALGFTNVYPMRYSFVADHFQYLAGVGLMALAAASLVKILRPVPLAAGMLPLGLAVLTWNQSHIYKDQQSLWQDTLTKNPGCWMARVNLGSALLHQDRPEEAISQYREALHLKPEDAEVHNNLGMALFTEGRTDEAIREYRESLRLNPNNSQAHNNLGNALLNQGQMDPAISQYQEAIRLKADYTQARYNLGTAFSLQGRNDEAVSQFQEALRLEPDNAEVHNNLGLALLNQGQTGAAVTEFEAAIHWKPENAQAHYNLGIALAKQAQMDAAIGQFEEAVRLKPDYIQARVNLTIIFSQLGQTDAAIGQLQETIRFNPDDASLHYNLGLLLMKRNRTDEAINEFEETLRLKPNDANAQINLAKAAALRSPSSGKTFNTAEH